MAAFILSKFKMLKYFKPVVISINPLNIELENGFRFRYLFITVINSEKKIIIPKTFIIILIVL